MTMTALLAALSVVSVVRGQAPPDLCSSDFVTNGTVTDALCSDQYATVRAKFPLLFLFFFVFFLADVRGLFFDVDCAKLRHDHHWAQEPAVSRTGVSTAAEFVASKL